LRITHAFVSIDSNQKSRKTDGFPGLLPLMARKDRFFSNDCMRVCYALFSETAIRDQRASHLKPGVESRRHPSRRARDMKKTFAALVAVTTIAGSLAVTPPAKAGDGGAIAAGVAGGLIGGALLGGAIAASRPAPVYVAPAPTYVEEAPCRWVRERFWDGYGWRFRRIEVCD
jgi:hypothetical protein